jgi:hypothetical protein
VIPSDPAPQGYAIVGDPPRRESLAEHGVRLSLAFGLLTIERDRGPLPPVRIRAFAVSDRPPPTGWALASLRHEGTAPADLSGRLGSQTLRQSGRFLCRPQPDGTARWQAVEVEAELFPGEALMVSFSAADLPEPDRNGDGRVDSADLSVVLGDFGTARSDLDGSGLTDAEDLAILLGAWTLP